MRAGEIVVCRVDCVIGTDGSGPMAIDYFEQMGGRRAVRSVARVLLARSLRAADTPETMRVSSADSRLRGGHGATVFDVGDGISHQVVVERGLVGAGDLVVGADSHTVTCGALELLSRSASDRPIWRRRC